MEGWKRSWNRDADRELQHLEFTMLMIKRLATSAAMFVMLFLFLFFGSLMLGGAVAGARASREHPGARDFRSGYQLGQEAGQDFGRRFAGVLFLASAGFSGVISLAVAFSGVLPWCRKPDGPLQPG